MTGSGTHKSWLAMRSRCGNPKHKHYPLYGGRGIKVCPQWQNSFSQFLADVGERPEGMSLDRFPDHDGDYEPGNVRWATQAQQMYNTRMARAETTADGSTMCVGELASRAGVHRNTVTYRLNKGYSAEQAVSTMPLDRHTARVWVNGWAVPRRSIAIWCGVTSKVADARLRAGWSVAQIMAHPERGARLDAGKPRPERTRRREWLNGWHVTRQSLALWSGLSASTMRTRLDRGWTLEEAMGRPHDPGKTHKRKQRSA